MPEELKLSPPWEDQLDLAEGDPAREMLAAISSVFATLSFSKHSLSQETEGDGFRSRSLGSTTRRRSGLNLEYGIDYFFGRYHGRPLSVPQNAMAAIFQKKQGVELWRIMKSIAFSIPGGGWVIAHARGDRRIDEAALAGILGIERNALGSADLSYLGVEYGTVSPFVASTAQSIMHFFDRDLISGNDYPHDDLVFTSSGDPRFYVGFHMQRYLAALSRTGVTTNIGEITRSERESARVFARRKVIVIGGDSGVDTFDFAKIVLAALRKRLELEGAYYGDRSLAAIEVHSDPGLAGSIDTALYGEELRYHVESILQERRTALEDPPRAIVTFSSMAMHGAAGTVLRRSNDIEYVGPREALLQIFADVAQAGTKIAFTALMGLASAYDEERSAFGKDILGITVPVDDNVKRQIQKLVEDCKKEVPDQRDFYDTIKKLLQRATRGQIDQLRGKSVIVILGASELETLVNALSAETELFFCVKSNDPPVIAAACAQACEKIRLILLRPGQAVAEAVANKTLAPPL